jgi:hypothetical protein
MEINQAALTDHLRQSLSEFRRDESFPLLLAGGAFLAGYVVASGRTRKVLDTGIRIVRAQGDMILDNLIESFQRGSARDSGRHTA